MITHARTNLMIAHDREKKYEPEVGSRFASHKKVASSQVKKISSPFIQLNTVRLGSFFHLLNGLPAPV